MWQNHSPVSGPTAYVYLTSRTGPMDQYLLTPSMDITPVHAINIPCLDKAVVSWLVSLLSFLLSLRSLFYTAAKEVLLESKPDHITHLLKTHWQLYFTFIIKSRLLAWSTKSYTAWLLVLDYSSDVTLTGCSFTHYNQKTGLLPIKQVLFRIMIHTFAYA